MEWTESFLTTGICEDFFCAFFRHPVSASTYHPILAITITKCTLKFIIFNLEGCCFPEWDTRFCTYDYDWWCSSTGFSVWTSITLLPSFVRI